MNIHKSTEPINVNIQYGEEARKPSLQAYRCENELKRAVKEKPVKVGYSLYNKYQIPLNYTVKISEPGEIYQSEDFSIIELINNKLTSINATVCLSIYDVYKEKGIEEAICKLHEHSPLTTI